MGPSHTETEPPAPFYHGVRGLFTPRLHWLYIVCNVAFPRRGGPVPAVL